MCRALFTIKIFFWRERLKLILALLVLCLRAAVVQACSAGHLKDLWQHPRSGGAQPALVVLQYPNTAGCKVLQGQGKAGESPLAGLCNLTAALGRLLGVTRAKAALTHNTCRLGPPESRRSKVIVKLLLFFLSLAAISMPHPPGNTV